MPQGKPEVVPTDGLTTRQRRNRPLLAVHTGEMKGKSTAAFGMALRAWNQGWSIGVFQFVKSAKWKVGEEAAFRALGRLYEETGEGGPVEWHKMGEGWSWARKSGTDEDHAARAGPRSSAGLPPGRTTSTSSTSSATCSNGAGWRSTTWCPLWSRGLGTSTS
jgi:cob(I)alamin adenosyltransferase